MDGWMPPGGPCRRMSRPMTMCVSLQVSVYGARGSPVPIRARAGQLVTPGRARPAYTDPGVCVSLQVSVYGARPCLPVCPPKGPRQLVTGPPSTNPSAPDPAPARRLPPRQLGQPTGRRPPHRAPTCAPPLPPSSLVPSLARAPCRSSPAPAPGPYDGARARGSLLATSARAPAQLPRPRPPRPPRARLRRPFPYTYPPTSTGPHRAGKRSRVRKSFRGRPTFAGRPRASHAAMCPGQLATALRHQAAARAGPCCRSGRAPGHLGPPTGVVPWRVEIRGNRSSPVPRVSGEGCLAPSKRPALPDPLVGGVCQQI
ncbi:hypothetical protein P174DRAFT_474087 [Aspergillus novofumigatus IBT 16806]|uniref:Uncharacterized protein n=1 Tax=Aspergillus novofumigatus (strain IBT 16806) TaxID=1392255 RepID=A0A2I1BSB7_ASPN1|nr:hypothetical protein P174DRAFT_474087 [Aspergillus novofumigatus IBT 16806]